MSGLRCRVPGCKVKIRAMTGLEELSKLIKHLRRAHLAEVKPSEALELRAKWEREAEAEEKAAKEKK